MKRMVIAFAVLAMAGCKPSDFYAADKRDDELLGAPDVKSAGRFPAGCWEDGLGNAWNVSMTGNAISGQAAAGNLQGLSMTGTVKKDTLEYSLGSANSAPLATGSARLVDSQHAWFTTSGPAGALNAHGLFHFNHPAQLTAGPPAELQPVADCANPTLQGD